MHPVCTCPLRGEQRLDPSSSVCLTLAQIVICVCVYACMRAHRQSSPWPCCSVGEEGQKRGVRGSLRERGGEGSSAGVEEIQLFLQSQLLLLFH